MQTSEGEATTTSEPADASTGHLQSQQHGQGVTASSSQATIVDDSNIIYVWSNNVDDAFREIREIVRTHPYVAMDTEFPGVVARPYGTFRSHTDYQYQALKCNVDVLRIIQLGLTFSDEEGNLHPKSTWQFHFQFDLKTDVFAQDSIDLLQKAGVDFEKHEKDGINVEYFGALMMVSGLTLTDEVRWLSFHSYYDFGYLVKVADMLWEQMMCALILNDRFCIVPSLPRESVTALQYILKSCEPLKGGLSKIAQALEVERVGLAHQAGSDSLVTALAFFKMSRIYFDGELDPVPPGPSRS